MRIKDLLEGTQFKQAQEPDDTFLQDILEKSNPELYKKYYEKR